MKFKITLTPATKKGRERVIAYRETRAGAERVARDAGARSVVKKHRTR